MREMRENALPILEAEGVDLVLTGHSHSYERSFLIDGHYGASGTFVPSMKKDGGSGREDGSGAYQKPTSGPASHEGAAYAVAGSSGQIAGGALNHPAMFVSLNVLGSMVLDVTEGRLDAKFIDTPRSSATTSPSSRDRRRRRSRRLRSPAEQSGRRTRARCRPPGACCRTPGHLRWDNCPPGWP